MQRTLQREKTFIWFMSIYKDIELGEKAAESKRQAIEFKQPATELEGKVKDFCIVSWDIRRITKTFC